MITTVGPKRPAVEVADVIREHGKEFMAKYGALLTVAQRESAARPGDVPHGGAGRTRRAVPRLWP